MATVIGDLETGGRGDGGTGGWGDGERTAESGERRVGSWIAYLALFQLILVV